MKRKLPIPLQNEVDLVLEENDSLEVEKMITNIERALDKMQRAAEIKGIEKGQTKGNMEVAKAALRKGFSIEDVVEITGLSRETVLGLKNKMEN